MAKYGVQVDRLGDYVKVGTVYVGPGYRCNFDGPIPMERFDAEMIAYSEHRAGSSGVKIVRLEDHSHHVEYPGPQDQAVS